jgi:hypothetical protein
VREEGGGQEGRKEFKGGNGTRREKYKKRYFCFFCNFPYSPIQKKERRVILPHSTIQP